MEIKLEIDKPMEIIKILKYILILIICYILITKLPYDKINAIISIKSEKKIS